MTGRARRGRRRRGSRSAVTGARLHAVEADRRDRLARREQRLVDEPAGGDHRRDRAGLEVVEEDDVGAPAGRDHAAVAQARRRRAAVSEAAR